MAQADETKGTTQNAGANPSAAPVNPSPTNLAAQNQKTLPSRPLDSSLPRAELGDSGTRMLHGIIVEEYNSQLQGIQGIRVFDEMRKSDGTVRAACLAITLPIRRAEWFVKPATDDQQGQDIANFVSHALFEWVEDTSWDDILRQALLMVPFGVMLFEKVYGIKEHEGKEYVTLQKLAPRLPKSIMMWELADRTFGIQQIRQDGIVAQIPGSKLLIFVNEREGDNWWGTSMLRAAYKHWYYKDNFYKIDSIAFERQGIGVPKITMPAGYTINDEKKAQNAMANLRANEDAFLLLPPGYTAEFMNMGANTTRTPETSINHHNKEILQSILAQFLELGVAHSNTGSHALSSDHSDLFLKAIESIANTLISEINKKLIPELVDLNFTGIDAYPVLDYSGIDKVDVTALGTAYAQLVTAGAITPTPSDQQYIRAAMGLPPRTPEEIEQEDDNDPTTEDLVDHANIEDVVDPNEPTDPEEPQPGDKPASKKPAGPQKTGKPQDNKKPNTKPAATPADKKKVDDASAAAKKEPQTPDNKKKTDSAAKKAHDHGAHTRKLIRRFQDGKGFMSWRPLTFAEQKVDWSNIQDAMDAMQNDFETQANALLGDAKDQFMSDLHEAITNNDQKAISALEIGFVAEYKKLLKDTITKAYNTGKETASSEIGLNGPPPSNADSMASIELLAQTIADKTISELESEAKLSAVNALKTDQPPLQASGAIDSSLDDTIAEQVDDTSGIIVAQAINNGRFDTFERNSSLIQSLQRSEILDEKTCDFCLSMDGLVVTVDDQWAQYDTFHDNCRGIWVATLNDEINPPEITGVPDNIGQYYGGQPNELVQPRKPIIRPDSPAAAEVARRNAEK